jgi:hypothetical protein
VETVAWPTISLWQTTQKPCGYSRPNAKAGRKEPDDVGDIALLMGLLMRLPPCLTMGLLMLREGGGEVVQDLKIKPMSKSKIRNEEAVPPTVKVR